MLHLRRSGKKMSSEIMNKNLWQMDLRLKRKNSFSASTLISTLHYHCFVLIHNKRFVHCLILTIFFEYTTHSYATQRFFGTSHVSACYDFLRSTTHCYPWIWFQSLVETQGLPLSMFGPSPQSILHLTNFGWTHKITVSGLGLVNLALPMLSGASLLLKLI